MKLLQVDSGVPAALGKPITPINAGESANTAVERGTKLKNADLKRMLMPKRLKKKQKKLRQIERKNQKNKE